MVKNAQEVLEEKAPERKTKLTHDDHGKLLGEAVSLKEPEQGVVISDNVHTRLVRALTETLTYEQKIQYEQSPNYRLSHMDTFFHKMTFNEKGEIIKYSEPDGRTDYTFAECVIYSDKISWEQKLLYLFYPDGDALRIKPWAVKLLVEEQEVKEGLAQIFNNIAKERGVFNDDVRKVSFTIDDKDEGILNINVVEKKDEKFRTDTISLTIEALDFNDIIKRVFGDNHSEEFGEYTRLIQEAIEKIKDMAIETAKEKAIEYTKMAVGALVAFIGPIVLAALGIKSETDKNKNDDKK